MNAHFQRRPSLKKALFFIPAIALLLTSHASFSQPLTGATDSLAPASALLRSELATSRFVADVDDASALYVNPAGLAMRRNVTSLLQGTYWYDRLSELTLGVAAQNVGFGLTYTDDGVFTSRNYVLGFSSRLASGLSIGSSFTWHHTNLPYDHRTPLTIDLGFMIRPIRFLSIGGVWKNVNQPRFADGFAYDPFSGAADGIEDSFLGGLSLRPFGERVTISGQAEVADQRKPGWLFGGRVSLAPGVELFGSYTRDTAWPGTDPYEEFTGGVGIRFGSMRACTASRSRVDGDKDYARNSFSLENTDAFVRGAVAHRPRFAEITIEGNYLDEGGGFSLMGGSKNLHAILGELKSIRGDDDVKGLLLKIGSQGGAFIGPVSGNLNEIRQSILEVKKAGKPVVAYMREGGSSAELYLAAAADRIVTPQIGTIGMLGVSLEINRMKRLFEKLGVDFDHYTAGAYKSSFHTLYTDTTTAAQAEEMRSLVEESYRLLVEGIAAGRGITIDHMRELADGRVFTPDELIAEHLVDAIGWEKDAKAELGRLAGARKPVGLETESIGRRTYWTERWTEAPAVAIVGAYGGIQSGKSSRSLTRGSRTMGSETVAKQLKAASRYPGIRAIVLRVDSGGGSALASDEILEEIRRIKSEVKIPVVVSMGNVAASGGYWISMYGDRIFADPFTLTGSIGVVWFKPVLERLYEKIGVSNEVFKEGEHVDALSSSRRMTDEEMEMLGSYIDRMYGIFVDKVAEGRKLDPTRVREIGGGRVYLGTQALGIKLVDELGGLSDAVSFAASKAGIEKDYRTIYFKAFPGFFAGLSGDASPVGIARTIMGLIRGAGGAGYDETVCIY
jgi:protease-4